jgi:hypothetical protein
MLTMAATTGALLSMASKDRVAALGLPPAPERALGWLLGGRDGRLLLVAVGAVLGAPVAALAAVSATSALSLGLRVAFLRRPPKAGPAVRHLFIGSPPQASSSHRLLGVFTSSGGPGGRGRSLPERRSVGRAPCVLQPVDEHL